VQRCDGGPSTVASAAFQPRVRAGDQLDSDEAARDQRSEELAPERLGLRLADVEADDLAPAGLTHAMRDDNRLARDTAAVADLLG
jgi:hypothetical protein